MNKYNEAIEKIKVTEDMRTRILKSIPEKINETDQPLKRMPRRQLSLNALIIPIISVAAAALLAWMIIPQFIIKEDAASGNAAKSAEMVKEETAAQAGGYNAADNGAEYAPMDAAVPEEPAGGEAETVDAEEPEEIETVIGVTASQTAASELPDEGEEGGTLVYSVEYYTADTGLKEETYNSAALVSDREILLDNYVSEDGLDEDDLKEYDDAFFSDKDLIVVLLKEPSISIDEEVNSVIERADGGTEVTIYRLLPEMQADQMVYWYIMIGVDKGTVSDDISLSLIDIEK